MFHWRWIAFVCVSVAKTPRLALVSALQPSPPLSVSSHKRGGGREKNEGYRRPRNESGAWNLFLHAKETQPVGTPLGDNPQEQRQPPPQRQHNNNHRRLLWQRGCTTLATFATAVRGWTGDIPYAHGTQFPSSTVLLQGTVAWPPNVDPTISLTTMTTSSTGPALYVTVRPDRPDHIPTAIRSGTRGKPPPVLTVRLEQPVFPVTVVLTERDLTVEGNRPGTQETDGTYWWSRDDLIVSARWDTDGVAATRSPDDLVGRTRAVASTSPTLPTQSQPQPPLLSPPTFQLTLTGRGAFGKLATGGSATP
jgi:hypothetical protein